MRTTVTLDTDTEQLLRRRMAERKVSFKQALNDAIRSGLASEPPAAFRTKTFEMGRPQVDVTKALQLAGALEDDELIRKTHLGK